MKTKYFTISESDGTHIGTIFLKVKAQNTEGNLVFKNKIRQACEEHFDETVEIPDEINFEDYIFGRFGDIKIHRTNFTEIEKDSIYIQETWLY